MKFEERGCPCTNDCQNRSAWCRKTCDPFADYEKRRMEKKVNTRVYCGDFTDGKLRRVINNARYKQKTAQGRL